MTTTSRTATAEPVRSIRELRAEYAFRPDVMSEEDERVAALKYILSEKLDAADRNIFLLYLELQSYRKVAQCLNTSHTTILTMVLRIKDTILDEYSKIKK